MNIPKNLEISNIKEKMTNLENEKNEMVETIKKLQDKNQKNIDFEKIISQDDELINEIASKQIEIDNLNEKIQNLETSILSIQNRNDEN